MKIRPIELRDLESVLRISDEELGPGFVTSNDLDSGHTWVYENQNEVLGFLNIEVINKSELKTCGLNLTSKTIDSMQEDKPILWFKDTAVLSSSQGKGIGSKLASFVLSKHEYKDHYLIEEKWQRKSHPVRDGLTAKFGAKCVEDIPNYWKKISVENQLDCPECGKPPCECSARIFLKV